MNQSLIRVTIFAVAMAFMESAVVIYLREIYYPEGFDFPLHVIGGHIATTEIIREFATMVMLLIIGILASKKRAEIAAWFIYAFAVWDIFYYIFLKLILGWPSSLLTWDILFLIPTTWTGPVLAPLINSASMILLGLIVVFYSRKGKLVTFRKSEWGLIIAGCLLTVTSYVLDYTTFMLHRFTLGEIFSFSSHEDMPIYASGYIPVSFNWYPFALGEICFVLTTYLFWHRVRRQHP